ncbi:Outer membrane efflux protein [Planctomycetes bacterium Pan216]|uniref:Outer membrane efflux protein n=1 Tax=Kolteria novifilia TaxID=2527975 RepID=A0A518B3D4_9BACT|nr:Outer membrane efflux protein [Planctomycetes bacterium Pan216]
MPPPFTAVRGFAPRPRVSIRPVIRWAIVLFALSVAGCAAISPSPPFRSLSQRVLPPEPAPTTTDVLPIDTLLLKPPESAELPTLPESTSSPDVVPMPGVENITWRRDDLEKVIDERQGPLRLEEALALAERLNPRLQKMRARVDKARAGKHVAFAALLPEARISYRDVAGTPAAAPFSLPTIPSSVGNITFGGASDHFQIAELNMQWTIWDFGRLLGRFGQAQDRWRITELQWQRARQTIHFDVTTSYLELLRARANRRIAEESVRRAESHLTDARHRLRRGTGLRNDVLESEVLVSQSQLVLVKARTSERVALAGLNRKIGLNVSEETDVLEQADEPFFDLSVVECLQWAVDHRDEIGVVLRGITIAQRQRGISKAEFLPEVKLGGVGSSIGGRGIPTTEILTGGVNVELGLFAGGQRLARMKVADAELAEAFAHGKEVCDLIAYEVWTAYLSVADAKQRLSLAAVAVESATENLRLYRKRLERGDAIPTDVVNAELTMTRAQQGWLEAVYDYQESLAAVAYAVGVPLDRLTRQRDGQAACAAETDHSSAEKGAVADHD